MSQAEIRDLKFWRQAFWSGVFAALVMSVLMTLGISIHRSSISYEMALGSLITQRLDVSTWVLGMGWHMLNGGFFAVTYAAVFKLIGRAGIGWGAFLGMFHWLAACAFIGWLPVMGGVNYLSTLFLHLVFGAVVGGALRLSLRRTQREEESSEESYLRPTG